MSIEPESVEEIIQRQQAVVKEDNTIEAVRIFRVRYGQDQTPGAPTVINATGVPEVGDVHPDDSNTYMKQKTARVESDKTPWLWIVTCQYVTVSGLEIGESRIYPWDYPPEVDVDNVMISKPFTTAWDENWREANGAWQGWDKGGCVYTKKEYIVGPKNGMPFDPVPEGVDIHAIIRIRKNYKQEDFDVQNVSDYTGTLNCREETIVDINIPALQGRMNNINLHLNWWGDIPYFEVEFEIEIGDFIREFINESYYYTEDGPFSPGVYATADQLESALTKNLERADQPVKLDLNGNLLDEGDKTIILGFLENKPTNWQALDLPRNMPSQGDIP